MGLENLSSVFSDISRNSIDPIDGANSPAKQKPTDAQNFNYTPFPEKNSEFANQSISLVGGESLIDTEIEHTFGTQGNSKELVKIEKIDIKQEDSPLTKQPLLISADEKTRQRESSLFQNLGQNNRLGLDSFVLESLYNVDHTAPNPADREPIQYGQVEINTLRSGIGALSNLDMFSYSDGLRTSLLGPEPYVITSIGDQKNRIGHNRETIPFQGFADDVSRILHFYSSGKGLLSAGKDLLYGGLFATNLSGLPNSLGQYSGGKSVTIPEETKKLFNSLNTVRLLTHTMIPAVPTINTGLLNFYGQTLQSPGIESLRKPFAIGYSKLIKENDTLSPINQLQAGKGILDKVPPLPPYEKIPEVPGGPVREYGKRVLEKGDSEKKKPSPFFRLGSGVGLVEYKKSVDKIAESRPLDPVVDENTEESLPPLENNGSGDIQNGDFYVRIKDLRDSNFVYFRGYVTGITENVNPSFNPVSYIGRSEPVYLYDKGDRDVSFNLRMFPNNPLELDTMYQKLDRLTSLAYPDYIPESDDETVLRKKAPFTELYMAHIGSKAKGQFGFIKSLSYTVNEAGDWDVDTNLPRLIDVAISYQILGDGTRSKRTPSKFTTFYPMRAEL